MSSNLFKHGEGKRSDQVDLRDNQQKQINKIGNWRDKNKFLLEKNDEKLNTIASLEKEVIDNREETMLRNNYNYSIENEYTTALFFIGSGHMHTILPKIKAWSEKEGNVINWLFYKDIKWS